MRESVLSLKDENNTTWISYHHIARQYYEYFITDPLNTIFDNFGIWLLGYLVESVVYIYHKGIYVLSVIESPPLMHIHC